MSKDPRLVEAGRRGARRRWGEQRVARLDQLDPTVRLVILALVEADKAARTERALEPEAAKRFVIQK